jgi:hypothetical protein
VENCGLGLPATDDLYADRHSFLARAKPHGNEKRARAIYSGIVGAQLMARSRADITLYDSLIESYRTAGLLPV